MSGQVEIITSVQRRRRWSSAEKEQLVAASLEPDASVSAVARIHPSQLYGWRRQLRAGSQIGFAPVRIAPSAALASPGTIEIEFATGTRMRITGAVDAATLTMWLGRWRMDGSDDPNCFGGAGVDCNRPDRHAPRYA